MGNEYGPLYEQLDGLRTEYATEYSKSPTSKVAANMRHLNVMDDARLDFWERTGAQDRLDTAAADADPVVSTDAKMAQAIALWWNGFGDPEAQAKVVDQVEPIAIKNPTSANVADGLHLMLVTATTSVEVGQRLTDILCKTMGKTAVGHNYNTTPNRLEMPLSIEGTEVTGKPFTSTAWAGKVVLIDFWATWCPPCREEIPKTAKIYAQYHPQGFEIIGVSSDSDRNELRTFVQQHSEMPWPELFHAGTDWHPLTKKFGIHSIPTMYLVDRNGNLRSMDARDDMGEMIPKLLAEPCTPKVVKSSAAHTIGSPIAVHHPIEIPLEDRNP